MASQLRATNAFARPPQRPPAGATGSSLCCPPHAPAARRLPSLRGQAATRPLTAGATAACGMVPGAASSCVPLRFPRPSVVVNTCEPFLESNGSTTAMRHPSWGAQFPRPMPQPARKCAVGTASASSPQSPPPNPPPPPPAASPPPPPFPPPPPLSELPTPMAADSIPPLLSWVPRAELRPVAVQSILERLCSADTLAAVRAAVQRAAGGGATRVLPFVQPAHLALGALSSRHPDTDAVMGLLHHRGLSLGRCQELLTRQAAEQAAREEEEAAADAGVDGAAPPPASIFSAAAQHFIFQAHRWSVYTGCDCVLPCHLLWALCADPRVSYSAGRTDPLDGRVLAWEAWEPPLLAMLRTAGLERRTEVYDEMLGNIQRQIEDAAGRAFPPLQTAKPGSSSSSSSGSSSSSSLPPELAALHQELERRAADLERRAAVRRSREYRDAEEAHALLSSCQAAGLVLSRPQLKSVRSSFQYAFSAWGAVAGVVLAFAAAGFNGKDGGDLTFNWIQFPREPPAYQKETVRSVIPHQDYRIDLVCQLASVAPTMLMSDGGCNQLLSSVGWLQYASYISPLQEMQMLVDACRVAGARAAVLQRRMGELAALLHGGGGWTCWATLLTYLAVASEIDVDLRNTILAGAACAGVQAIDSALASLPIALRAELLTRLVGWRAGAKPEQLGRLDFLIGRTVAAIRRQDADSHRANVAAMDKAVQVLKEGGLLDSPENWLPQSKTLPELRELSASLASKYRPAHMFRVSCKHQLAQWDVALEVSTPLPERWEDR